MKKCELRTMNAPPLARMDLGSVVDASPTLLEDVYMSSIRQQSSVREMQTQHSQEFERAHVWWKGMSLIVV